MMLVFDVIMHGSSRNLPAGGEGCSLCLDGISSDDGMTTEIVSTLGKILKMHAADDGLDGVVAQSGLQQLSASRRTSLKMGSSRCLRALRLCSP